MKEKVKIILIYNSLPFIVLRLGLVLILLLLILIQSFSGTFPNILISLLFFVLFIEIFIKYGIGKIYPLTRVSENSNEKYNSFTKESLEGVLLSSNSKAFLNKIIRFPQVKFILHKSAINRKEIQNISLNLEEVTDFAFEQIKRNNGSYVTSGDLFIAYLLLSEAQTKLLFNKKLTDKDLLNINNWSKIAVDEEDFSPKKAKFTGNGIGEDLTTGWTPEAKKYTRDHTYSNVHKKILIEGRESEYKLLIEAMQRPEGNNVLLVGDLGSGKNNLIDNFIFESYEAKLPKVLNHRKFLELMIGPFIAGSVNREDLEVRLQSIIEEIKHSGNVILYIPEFQNLLGSSSYNIDMSGAILPYLRDGKMPIIATITKGEYKELFEKNTLKEVFEVIFLEEPSPEIALKMLFQKTEEIEKENGVFLSYASVISAVKYSKKYEPDAILPGSAVDLLNAASNSVRINKGKNSIVLEGDVVSAVEQKSKIPVGAPNEKEKSFLLNLESEMHKFIIGQNDAIKSIAEALRRIRTGIAREKPVSFLFLGPTGVGKTETAKTLARLYFGGEEKIIRLDMSEYGTPDSLSRMLQSGAGSFLDIVSTHPFSLVLLDEFEKADLKIRNLFLQVFDDGRMTDEVGKTVSFSNTIIITTSNAGSEFIREKVNSNSIIDSKVLLEYLQTKGIFTPELLNRFDEVVVFKPLNQSEITEVTNLVINDLITKLSSQDIFLTVTNEAIEKISKSGYDQEFGARPLRRFIQNNIEDAIAKKMLSGEISRGDKIQVALDSNLNLSVGGIIPS